MAKGLRSKIKRRFRTELRERVGVPVVTKQEEKIQAELAKVLAQPTTSSSSLLAVKSTLQPGSSGLIELRDERPPEPEVAPKKANKKPVKSVGKKKVKVKRKKFFHFHKDKKIGE